MRTDRQPDVAKLIDTFAILGTRLKKELACIIFMVCNGTSVSPSAVHLAILASRELESDENCQSNRCPCPHSIQHFLNIINKRYHQIDSCLKKYIVIFCISKMVLHKLYVFYFCYSLPV